LVLVNIFLKLASRFSHCLPRNHTLENNHTATIPHGIREVAGVLLITSTGPGSGYIYVNVSSRNGTLGTHPQFAPPKWESLENVLQKVLNITFPFPKHFGYFFIHLCWWIIIMHNGIKKQYYNKGND